MDTLLLGRGHDEPCRIYPSRSVVILRNSVDSCRTVLAYFAKSQKIEFQFHFHLRIRAEIHPGSSFGWDTRSAEPSIIGISDSAFNVDIVRLINVCIIIIIIIISSIREFKNFKT